MNCAGYFDDVLECLRNETSEKLDGADGAVHMAQIYRCLLSMNITKQHVEITHPTVPSFL